jgi:D-alanine-D-alanine ligase-like ATP-grasp enzyme
MGKFIDAIRRDPPVVVGDGQSSLRQLIAYENKLRENQPPTRALSPLVIDADARNWMDENAMRLSDVPQSGEKIQVKRAVNENDSSGNLNVTRQVNAQIVAKCGELVERLGVEFAGVDLICDDISGPFHPDNCRIGEINTTPGLHHHYLIANPDEGNLVAETVLEHMLAAGIGTMTIGESNGNPNGAEFQRAAEIKKFPGTFGPRAKGSAATDSAGY